jgi:hypothetical protein
MWTDVSEEVITYIFMVSLPMYLQLSGSLFDRFFNLKMKVINYTETPVHIGLHCGISHKISTLITTAVRTWELIQHCNWLKYENHMPASCWFGACLRERQCGASVYVCGAGLRASAGLHSYGNAIEGGRERSDDGRSLLVTDTIQAGIQSVRQSSDTI